MGEITLGLPSQENPTTRTSEAQPRFNQEGNPASWSQPSFPSWTLCPHPTPLPSASLAPSAWAALACNICSSCDSTDGQLSGFASNSGEKKGNEMLGDSRGTGDDAVCPLPSLLLGITPGSAWQSPRIFPSRGSLFPSPVSGRRQPLSSFSKGLGLGE